MGTNITTSLPASKWDHALYAFLAEKERRSGSMRTVQAYSTILQDFFGKLGKTPDQATPPDIFSFAHGIGASGKSPSNTTVGARIACLSSLYRFLIRMELLASNPCDKLQRPGTTQSTPRGLQAEQVRKLLSAVPDNPSGQRDRAIILMLVLTGRRRTEVLDLKAGSLAVEGDTVYYRYRGKGGKTGTRELPRPAYDAIQQSLRAFGKELETMAPGESLWPSSGVGDRGISSGTFYGNLQRYFRLAGIRPAGVHIFRHTAAKLRRQVGEDVESVSQFLDHSSLGVTSIYLRRLEGQQDNGWANVARVIGVDDLPRYS